MRHVITAWGVLGVVAILARAVMRLTPYALEAATFEGLSALHIAAAVVWIIFMAYTEGYRGFQKAFAPRVVARAHWVSENPTALRVIFAPLFAMALFGATRRRLLVSWGIIVGVVALVILIRFLPQPWRGIVDSGVVVGLAWGTIAIVVFYVQLLTGRPLEVDLGLESSSPSN